MKTYLRLAAGGLLLGGAIGCEAPSVSNAPPTPAAAPTAEAKKDERPLVAGAPGQDVPEDEVPVTDIPRKFTAHDPIQGRRSRRAAAGGTSLGIGTTAAAGFYAKFQSMIQAIDYANELYWPQHNFEYPKTQEEYMKEVVKPALNGIPLPDLPEDEEYCYVPSQPKMGLQIRLKPGSPRSKVPAGTSPEEAIKMLGGQPPEGGAEAGAQAGASPAEQPAGEEPSPDIRTRAEQLNGAQTGGQTPGLSEKAKEHAVAPGGLAPAGGIE